MAHEHNHSESISKVYKGLILLAVVTLVEVIISLFGKGHIVAGVETNRIVIYGVALLIILLSIYKANFILFEFMHLKYEVKNMARSILLPMLLLVWALIAFSYEGGYWKTKRSTPKKRAEAKLKYHQGSQPVGVLHYDWSDATLG